jgi:hypothetical protein
MQHNEFESEDYKNAPYATKEHSQYLKEMLFEPHKTHARDEVLLVEISRIKIRVKHACLRW